MSESQPENDAQETTAEQAAERTSAPQEQPPRKSPKPFSSPEDKQLFYLTREIANQLGEKEREPLRQIRALIYKYGIDTVRGWVAQVEEIEANGGMLTNDGSRRRTPGGLFFYVVGARKHNGKTRYAPRPFPRELLLPMVEATLQQQGEVSEPVRVQLIGRPIHVEHRDEVCVLTLQEQKQPNNISRYLPAWPEQPTTYVVYLLWDTWNPVDRKIQSKPEIMVDIEGEIAFDTELGHIVVFGQSVKTRFDTSPEARQARLAEQQARAEALRPTREAEKAEKKAKKEAAKAEKAIQRLFELNKAVQDAEAKLEEIRALPASQQQGLFTAMREVQRVNDELRKFREDAQKAQKAASESGESSQE